MGPPSDVATVGLRARPRAHLVCRAGFAGRGMQLVRITHATLSVPHSRAEAKPRVGYSNVPPKSRLATVK